MQTRHASHVPKKKKVVEPGPVKITTGSCWHLGTKVALNKLRCTGELELYRKRNKQHRMRRTGSPDVIQKATNHQPAPGIHQHQHHPEMNDPTGLVPR